MKPYFLRPSFLFAALCAASLICGPTACRSQEADEAETEPTADRFVVPEGTPEELLAFIGKLAEPEEPYSTRIEIRQVAGAISTAADKILASEKASDFELTEAVEWRIGALTTLAQLGDRDAAGQIDEVLTSLASDSRPVVANIARYVRLSHDTQRWYELDAAAKQTAANDLVALFKDVELEPRHLGLIFQLGDMVADTEDSQIISPALDELLPLVKQSKNPLVARQFSSLEGIIRRVNLLGSQLELDGQLLDGSSLDWQAYRGKVVLVDFWATWCGPCRAEVPNLLTQYRMYKDKGFDILGISLDKTRDDAQDYIDQTGIPWATVFSDDPETTGWNAPMATKYAINAIPRAILVDKEGNVVHMNARGELLGEQLAKLLGEPDLSQVSEAEESPRQTAQKEQPVDR